MIANAFLVNDMNLNQHLYYYRCRIWELHTLKGHLELVIKQKCLDVKKKIQKYYTVWRAYWILYNVRQTNQHNKTESVLLDDYVYTKGLVTKRSS